MSSFYTGIVENRSDPLRLGRCQVRIVGLHTHDKNQLPTADLPWSMPVQPIGSAAMNGIGYTPVGPVEGTTVIIMFADPELHQRLLMMMILDLKYLLRKLKTLLLKQFLDQQMVNN